MKTTFIYLTLQDPTHGALFVSSPTTNSYGKCLCAGPLKVIPYSSPGELKPLGKTACNLPLIRLVAVSRYPYSGTGQATRLVTSEIRRTLACLVRRLEPGSRRTLSQSGFGATVPMLHKHCAEEVLFAEGGSHQPAPNSPVSYTHLT